MLICDLLLETRGLHVLDVTQRVFMLSCQGRHINVGLVIKSYRILLWDLLSQLSSLGLQVISLSLVVHEVRVILQRLLVIAKQLMLRLTLVERLVNHNQTVIVLLLLAGVIVVLRLRMEIDLAHWWLLLQDLRVALVQAKIVRLLAARSSNYIRGLS